MKLNLTLCLAVFSLPMFGQANFEVQPFIGGMYGGTFNVSSSTESATGIEKIALQSSISTGITAGINLGDIFGAEFLWNYQPTTAVGKLKGGGEFAEKYSVNSNQYHGNMLFYFKPADSKWRPYALVGFGATNASGNNESVTKFSYGLGGGVKYYFTERYGVRLQARYAPTYLYTSSGGVWCNWWGYCWVVGDDHYMNQGDITAGFTIRF